MVLTRRNFYDYIVFYYNVDKLFFILKKAGKDPWLALIPFYNSYLIGYIASGKCFLSILFSFRLLMFSSVVFYVLGLFIGGYVGSTVIFYFGVFLCFMLPILSMAITAIVNLKLAQKFNKGPLFGIALAILPFVFYPILAFGKSEYKSTDDK